jgi:hypothetical protein
MIITTITTVKPRRKRKRNLETYGKTPIPPPHPPNPCQATTPYESH